MNGGGTLGALSSHGLIEVHRHFGIEKLPRSHKALEMVPLEQSKSISKLWLLSHSFNVEIELKMKWLGSTIWIALNGRHGNHRPLDDGFRSNVGRMLRTRWGLRLRPWLSRRLSRAWGPGSLWCNAVYWWLGWRRSQWSPCQILALRRTKGYPALRRRNSRGLKGLRWILRSGGA